MRTHGQPDYLPWHPPSPPKKRENENKVMTKSHKPQEKSWGTHIETGIDDHKNGRRHQLRRHDRLRLQVRVPNAKHRLPTGAVRVGEGRGRDERVFNRANSPWRRTEQTKGKSSAPVAKAK